VWRGEDKDTGLGKEHTDQRTYLKVLVHEKGLGHWRWVGQPRGLDEDMVELAGFALEQVRQDADKVPTDRAADAYWGGGGEGGREGRRGGRGEKRDRVGVVVPPGAMGGVELPRALVISYAITWGEGRGKGRRDGGREAGREEGRKCWCCCATRCDGGGGEDE